jgi:hypothetical protein
LPAGTRMVPANTGQSPPQVKHRLQATAVWLLVAARLTDWLRVLPADAAAAAPLRPLRRQRTTPSAP